MYLIFLTEDDLCFQGFARMLSEVEEQGNSFNFIPTPRQSTFPSLFFKLEWLHVYKYNIHQIEAQTKLKHNQNQE